MHNFVKLYEPIMQIRTKQLQEIDITPLNSDNCSYIHILKI
jgi:hypothetical protein